MKAAVYFLSAGLTSHQTRSSLITGSWRSLNPSCRVSDLPAPLCWSKTRRGTSSTSWRTRGTSRTAASSRSTAKSRSTGRTRVLTTPTWPTETCGWVSPLIQLQQLCLQTPRTVTQHASSSESSDLSPGPAPARHVFSATSTRRQQAVRWETRFWNDGAQVRCLSARRSRVNETQRFHFSFETCFTATHLH